MIFFCLLSAIHISIFGWIWYHWMRIPFAQTDASFSGSLCFSVIIPVRNEALNLGLLLEQIDQQDYDAERYEVIVIDDHSEDDTVNVVKAMISKVSYRLTCLRAEPMKTGKKSAIAMGVSAAKHPYIITTDGDCEVKEGWISSYAMAYEQTENVMLTGSVKMFGTGILSAFQSVEFSSLIGFGAAALQSGNPSMCNGANLSYRRDVFLEVGGYEGNDRIPSGDDEFLLQKVFGYYPGKICFVKNPANTVATASKQTLGALINQRIRWSGKWKYHKSWFVKGSAIYVFFDFALLIVSMILALTGYFDWQQVSIIVLARWMVDYAYMRSVGRFFGISTMKVLGVSLGLQIIYPVFVSLLGLASIFGKYSWKGRKYS